MSVQVRLLGGFGVDRDHVPVARDAWGRRQAAQLVQLLALTRDRRMHREQVIDALWPGLSWDAAGPRLHKAAHYARRALDDARMDAKVLDAIVMATSTPDYPFPSSACVLEDLLGARNVFSFDVNAACSGFLNALSVADSFIRTGQIGNALVVGSDALSRLLNWQDRTTCILFGDGAGGVRK